MKAIIAIVAVSATIVTGIVGTLKIINKRSEKRREELMDKAMSDLGQRAVKEAQEDMNEIISIYLEKYREEEKATKRCEVIITEIIEMFGIEIAKRELELNGWHFNAENNTFSYRKVVVAI